METSATSSIKPLKYKQLKATHPEYDLPYWQELRALYEGGKALLKNPLVFERLFPKHEGETDAAYTERKRRAYYVNHLGTVIDFIIAGLAQDPARIVPPGAGPGKKVDLDKYYVEFADDCSPPGGKKQPFADLLRELARTALLLKRWWVLVDMPKATTEVASRAEQIEAGHLEAYAIQLDPECVLDWQHDKVSGELLWVMTCHTSMDRNDPSEDRSTVTEVYTQYTRVAWARWVVTYKLEGGGAGIAPVKKGAPGEDDIVPFSEAGTHGFGRVPVIGDELPPGLWAGNKIHSLAVEYLNKSCGLSWAEYKDIYQQLYEFNAPEMPGVDTPIAAAQENPNRSRGRRGIGIVQIRGAQDDARFIGPDTSGFKHVQESLKDKREDIYRITYQMALSEDGKGALVRRSAESKKFDHAATNVVLGAVGDTMRKGGTVIVDTVAIGRGDKPGFGVAGMQQFDVAELAELVEQAVAMETVPVPSATYQKKRKLRLVRADLGEEATPEVMEAVEKELEGAITQDQYLVPTPAELAAAGGGDQEEDDDDDDDEEDTGKPGAKLSLPPSKLPAKRAGGKKR